MVLPWAMALDVSYVGNHGFNRLRAFQGGADGSVDLNAVDIGAAFLPQNQDPTLGAEHRAGRHGVHHEPAAPVPRLRRHQRAADAVLGHLSFDPDVAQPALQRGLAFGTNYTLGLSLKGNTGLQSRLQHAADGTISLRADQAEYEKLNENLALQRHVIKSYAVWDLPDAPASFGRIGRYLLNDWQLSGVLTAGSAYQPAAPRRTTRRTAGTISPISTRTTAPT